MGTMPVNPKEPKTATISSAAPEISGAVRVRPRATETVLSPVARYSSRTRPSRKTS